LYIEFVEKMNICALFKYNQFCDNGMVILINDCTI